MPSKHTAGSLEGRAITSVFAVLLLILMPGCRRTIAPAGGKQITDELGRKITLPGPPQRIISLAPSITETLFALGLKDRIVGVTSFCDYPQEAAGLERVGDTLRPSAEKIVSLRADLVVASTSSQLDQLVKKLDQIGIAVYVSNPHDFDGVLKSIERLGEVTGAVAQAHALAADMQSRADNVAARVSLRGQPSVLLLVGTQPLIAAGGTSFLSDLIRRAGGRSIADDIATDYPQLSLETALARQPEVIFLQAGDEKMPGRLGGTPAARTGRVYHVPDDLLLRPGPRVIDGLEEMARKIHPDDD